VRVALGVIPGTVPGVVREAVRNGTPQAIPTRIVWANRTATCRPIRELVQRVTGGATHSRTGAVTRRATPGVIPD